MKVRLNPSFTRHGLLAVITGQSLAFAVSLVANSAQATVIFDDLGAALQSSSSLNSYGPIFQSFTTPAAAQVFTGLQLVLSGPAPSSYAGGDPSFASVTVGLYAFNDATSPGTLIATLGTIGGAVGDSTVYTVSLLANPELAASTRYWIGVTGTPGPDGSLEEGWCHTEDLSGLGVSGEFALWSDQNGGGAKLLPWAYMMQVSTSAIPDGGTTVALLGLAFVGTAAVQRKFTSN